MARSVAFRKERGRLVASCHWLTIGSVVPSWGAVCLSRITVKIGGSNRKAEIEICAEPSKRWTESLFCAVYVGSPDPKPMDCAVFGALLDR